MNKKHKSKRFIDMIALTRKNTFTLYCTKLKGKQKAGENVVSV